MPETTDWETKKFDELFDDEIRVLTRRREHDKDCSIDDLQGTLEALYVLEGNNIDGRSKVHEIALSASISAYEKFIEDWKNEKTTKK
ncbi:hypothetical protein [Treponema putidum]|uniref:Uncharacterized protein n=1 Tax=Treponema putidum TaxID=221027 RepID=A0ABY5HVH7_9SPIR|nr:hypothetical protein [Treponema putidum]AIN92812.1 hypothetical protein JO40_00635 [Treponema putidum]TWI74039.1 hypothetical protein JM98_02213 [Treponema putidum]UTY29065.1 hypothetical protein E4N76_08810 [Treponema putidum]